jgi:hypothetical protein
MLPRTPGLRSGIKKKAAISNTDEKLLKACSANAPRSSRDSPVIRSRLRERDTKSRPIRLAEAVPIVT